jgi:hypothetical protein
LATSTARASSTPEAAPSATETATPATADTSSAVPTGAVAGSVAPLVIPDPPKRDLYDLQRRLRPGLALTPTPVPTARPIVTGSESAFWVANQQTKSYFSMRARLALVTDHVYWFVEDGLDLPVSDLQAAATFFEGQTYSNEHRLFGSEQSPGPDHDVHLTILIGHIPGVGGYFSTADEYPPQVNPFSNQRNMIYINFDAVRPGSSGFNGTVSHEFMHMIQFNVHRDQNSWINEGSAELAAQAVTGAVSGGVSSFERQPQTQLNGWADEPAGSLPHYGAAYLFMRYVAEQFGGFGIVGKVIRSPGRDLATFDPVFRALSPSRSFDDVFGDWVAANFLDDDSLAGGRYGYKGITLHPAVQPGPQPGQQLYELANQLGASYFHVAADVPSHLKFAGAIVGQLIGAQPHGAEREWWSNHGDSIDSRLTRTVDLTGVRAATLHFWIWYDIEQDFDYGYVEVSTDGGRTWLTETTNDTTSSNPNGQNYGNGFTGEAGGRAQTWTMEAVDLSPFAGRTILLRFEYVTDDSYNGDGFALDGIEIPEIGYRDAANGGDGWQAEGFTRIDNRVSERYLVEAIDPAGAQPVAIAPVALDGTAAVAIKPGRAYTIAISGLTAETTHPSSYVLQLVPD